MNIMPRESLSHVMANTLRQRQMMGRFHGDKSKTLSKTGPGSAVAQW